MKLIFLSFLFAINTSVCFSQLFGAEIEITESTARIESIQANDIDGDGDLDVVSASPNDGKIAWYENDGFGSFSRQQIISDSVRAARCVYVADIDQDGDLDVISGSSGNNQIKWHENDGIGNFQNEYLITAEVSGIRSVIATDIDGDGDMDVLSASENDNKIAWYENDGSGNFNSQQVLSSIAMGAQSVFTSDIDGDGDLDVLSASSDDDKIAWYQNNGTEGFGSEQLIDVEAYGAKCVYSSDLDGDGDMDVLSASWSVSEVAWYQNDGAGNFSSEIIISTSLQRPESISASDMDNDGDMDVLTVSRDDGKTAWYENDGYGNIGYQRTINISFNSPKDICTADLNGDGDLEVLVASSSDGNIVWFGNDGVGNFSAKRKVTNSSNPNSIYSIDVDNDGDMDVLSASADDKIVWYSNEGSNGFGPEREISGSVNGVVSLYFGDIDNDGDLDVLSASVFDDKIAWYANDGSGNFDSQNIISTSADYARSVFAADLDSDGDLDVLSASTSDNKIAWYENDGFGSFGTEQVISTAAYQAKSVLASDIDNDGFLDVVTGFGNSVVWFKNDGSGGFASQQVIDESALGANSLHVRDFDNDGDFDILAALTFDNKIVWYENDGFGNFSNQNVISEIINGVSSLYPADINGDGVVDVLAVSSSYNGVLWYENDGLGNFGLGQTVSFSTYYPESVFSSDLDGDGDLDILSSCLPYGIIEWFENNPGEGCTDINACNYDIGAWVDNGTCCYSDCGCTNPLAQNYISSVQCEDGSCEFLNGCTDSNAYNYEPDATLDSGLCEYSEGCKNEFATNYDSAVGQDDGSCEFEITGSVFYDENENGIMDGQEYYLPFQTVEIESLDIFLVTNDQGEFVVNIGNENLAFFELNQSLAFPFSTTPNPVVFDSFFSSSTHIEFGISNEETDFSICLDLYPSGNGFLCNDYANHNICYRNMGNVPLDGIIEVEYDELFQGHQQVTSIDSINGNTVYMSFTNLLPGEMFFYDIDLLTPTVDHIGEFITSYARAYGYYEEEQVAYGEQELTMEVTCAYDPNDKQAFPLGYTDEHWLLPETEQEFLVRFQNTGNAPAQDVRVQDTIDVNYDMNSLRLVANSHSVMTTINEETRVVDFFFQDIQLPDSVNNEPESHGLISYAITPYADLPVGTELNNTAFIYFDNNEAIVTNTTWTTIHECGGEALFEASATEICLGENVIFNSSYDQVESYQWNIDSAPEISASSLNKLFEEEGEYIVQLVAENPLCNESTMQQISVYANPSSEFEVSFAEICTGESVDFNALGENVQSYSWQFNEEEVSEEEQWSHLFVESGDVEVQLITQNEICLNTQSQTIEVHSLPSAEITENGAILSTNESQSYQWLLDGELIEGADSQEYEVLEDGTYSVQVTNENNCSTTSEEVFILNIKDQNSPITLLYPNPMTDVAYLEFKDASEKTVKLLDSSGKEVRNWNKISQNKMEIQKEGLAAGNYTIQVKEDEKVYSVKLVVE